MCVQLIAAYQSKMEQANEAAKKLRNAKMKHEPNSPEVARAMQFYAQQKREAEQAEAALKANNCSYTRIAFVPV